MASRIRYKYSNEPLVLVSLQYFIHPIDGSKYQVQLNEGDKTFAIVEDTSGKTAVTGTGKSMHDLKINAKNALIKLGISFAEEERKKEKELTQA